MDGTQMLFWWVALPLAVLAGTGLMAVIQRAWPQRNAALAYDNGYRAGWDSRLVDEQRPRPPARRRPDAYSRWLAAEPSQPADLVSVWENPPPPRRPRRSQADTMDLVSSAYLAGKDGRPAPGEVHHVPGPADGYPPARLDHERQDEQNWRMAELGHEPRPRSVLRELGIEPGHAYPDDGWVTGSRINGQLPAGGSD